MPRRVSAAPQPVTTPRAPPAPPRAATPTTRAWGTSPAATTRRESPLARWERLHQPVIDVPARRSPISDKAREMAASVSRGSGERMTPRMAQEVIDGLNAFGLAEPVWPNLAGMGFREEEAGAIREQLKSFETSRRTSIVGTERLRPAAKSVEALTNVVGALLAGREPALDKLPAAQAQVLRGAGRLGRDEQLRQASALLDVHLEQFITDSPADLLDVSPAVVKAGLEMAIAAQARQLETAEDAGAIRLARHEGFSAFGQLRELAVIDPVAAQKSGAAFVKELRAAEQRTGTRVLE